MKNSIWMLMGRKEKVQMKIKEELIEPLRKEFPNVSYYPTVEGWTNVEVEVEGHEANY